MGLVGRWLEEDFVKAMAKKSMIIFGDHAVACQAAFHGPTFHSFLFQIVSYQRVPNTKLKCVCSCIYLPESFVAVWRREEELVCMLCVECV